MAEQDDDRPEHEEPSEDGSSEDAAAPRKRRTATELLRFLPDVIVMLGRLVKDPRVPRRAKLVTGGVVAYLVSPIDVLPDFIPGIGALDDIYIAIWAIRYLLNAAGFAVVKEAWPGTDEGFALLMVVVGQER